MKPRILILLASSVVFCTGNAMAPKKDKLAALLALLPTESHNKTASPVTNTSSVVAQDPQKEMNLPINALYRDQHFEHLKALKKQRRKKF